MELFFTDESFKIGGQPLVGVPFFVDPEMRLMNDINDFFLRELVPDGRTNSPQTWENYAYWLRDFFLWCDANGFDWKRVTRLEVSVYRDWSLETTGVKPATVNSRLTAVKRFYDWAVREGFVDENPIKEVDRRTKLNADADYLSHTNSSFKKKRNDLFLDEHEELPETLGKDEVKRIFRNVDNTRLKLMMAIMLECGLRRKEVARLPISLILGLEKDAQRMGPDGEIEMKLPAEICKGGKSRTVPISYMLVMKLRQYRTTERPKLVKKYRANHKKEPVAFWLNRLGNPISVRALSTDVRQACAKAGVDGVKPHKFRHTFATELYALTGDIRLVQKLLGHSNIHTTTIYEHTAANDRHGFLEDYQKEVDALIGGML